MWSSDIDTETDEINVTASLFRFFISIIYSVYTCKKRLHITHDQASFFVVVVFDIIEIRCISYMEGMITG